MSDTAIALFVRPEGDMLAEREPPVSTTGLIASLRSNLFGNLTDSLITLVLAFVILWSGWAIFSTYVLRANVEGVTQGEGTMARVISELDDKIATAQAIADFADQNTIDLINDQERELSDLARRISVLNLDSLETESRLGLTKRILPAPIAERFTIAQSKVPLSRVVELEIVRRELTNPEVREIPDLGAFILTSAEKQALTLGSQPWRRVDNDRKASFQSTLAAAKRLINSNVATDAGKIFVPISELRDDLDDLLSNVTVNGVVVDPSSLLERPTRAALQFNGLVDSVVATPLTIIPVSRLQKIRKDSLNPDDIRDLRRNLVAEHVQTESPGLEGRELAAALRESEGLFTDAKLFLNREMPGGFSDPLPASLIKPLDEMDFWAVAHVLAEPTGQALATTATESLTTPQKVPLVIEALSAASSPVGPYADMVRELTDSYENKDLAGMSMSLEALEPLVSWSNSRNGANWAVIRQNFWPRMLIGAYPQDKLWRVLLVLAGLIVAVAPLVVPAARKTPFFIFSGLYPLFLLFVLSGLAIRFYGFHGPEEGSAGVFSQLFSERGRVLQAFLMVGAIFLAWLVKAKTAFGKTAGPALLVLQVLAAGYFVIMIWGTVINPHAAHKNILVESNFTGMLNEDHPLGEKVDPAVVQTHIDELTARSEAIGISAEERSSLRIQAQELRPALRAAISTQRDFLNVVAEGRGTFVILPHAPSLKWGGLLVTMVLGVMGMVASLPIGIVLAFGRQSTLPIVRWFSTGLIEITRGVPLIALLLIVTFVLPKLLPPGTEYPKLGLVLLAICLFGGVYQAEVIRGGLQSLPKGQVEASRAMGLTFWQESRLITLPQALKAVIPAIVNTFIGLFKDTTLVIVVGIFDLLTVVDAQITAENAWNTSKPEALIVVSLIFFVLMFSLSRYSIWLEKRLATGHH